MKEDWTFHLIFDCEMQVQKIIWSWYSLSQLLGLTGLHYPWCSLRSEKDYFLFPVYVRLTPVPIPWYKKGVREFWHILKKRPFCHLFILIEIHLTETVPYAIFFPPCHIKQRENEGKTTLKDLHYPYYP